MKGPHKSPARVYYDELCRRPWFGLSRIGNRGALDSDTISIGPDLLEGLLLTINGLLPGCYAVRARIPAARRVLPDWGVLLVRPPFTRASTPQWVLRSRDGSQSICPARSGEAFVFGVEGGTLWI